MVGKEVKKIVKSATFVLLCLVLLSVFCGYCVALLSYSISNTIIPCCFQNASFVTSVDSLVYKPSGDPIDSPKPHTH
jgi:hypothetical protein